MLDIVITHYKESWSVGKPLFDLLALQRGVDFGSFRVLLVNDGFENKLPDNLFANYPYEVKQICIPHKGVSAARNAGLDNSTEDWIMFCDFDDTFYGLYSLRDIITVLPADFDMLWGQLLVEDFTKEKEELYITPDVRKFVFIHAKVYRRQFLVESGIRFDEEMPFQEDSLFNATIIARVDHTRIGEIKTHAPLYVWVRRPNSVTNSGREDEAIFGHFIRNLKVTEENRLHRDHESYCGMVTRTAYDTFYMVLSSEATLPLKSKILELFIPWIRERRDAYGKVPEETMLKIRAISRMELYRKPVKDDPVDVYNWLNLILTEESEPDGNNDNESEPDQA